MNAHKWLKPGLCGAVIGAALLGIGGFTWGGWVTGGTSHGMAVAMSRGDVVTALVPVCLDMSRTDPERAAKLKAIKDAPTYQQRDALIAAGWATAPGTMKPDLDIAQACLAALDVDKTPERPENTSGEG
ncbi:hypothetical protein [Leisingera caerulea]|uniref:Uncharacterized protein n=1 Tax=Leisingera caerulea TaxID=506591 RepID=A0A9Q9M546_LEICA|nr:hypothetical protein [Leisingera caerulea]UWQ56019.1 hypothetical protein K3721_18870 [Leisingera caerulea]